MRKFKLLAATLLLFVLLEDISINPSSKNPGEWLNTESSVALARRGGGGRSRGGSSRGGSGGRSRGGSFRRSSPSRSNSHPSSSGRSPSRTSSPSRSNSSPSRNNNSSSPSPSNSSPSRNNNGRSSSPSRTNSSPSPNNNSGNSGSSQPRESRGNTGGRTRGGSWKPQPTPAPRRNTTTTPQPIAPITPRYNHSPQRTPVTPSLDPSPRTIVVPVPVPVSRPQPLIYPVITPNQSRPPAAVQPEVEPGLPSAPIPSAPIPNSAPSAAGVSEPVQPNAEPSYSSGSSRTSGSHSGFPWGKFLLFLLVSGGLLAIAWFLLSKKRSETHTSKELTNNIVTVSKLQIAFLANAPDLQSKLSELTLNADTETPEGLLEFLQACALEVIRKDSYWTHVAASSQTVKTREEAARVFEQISIAERSNFSAETLSNVNGRVREREGVAPDPDEEPGSYIVVTFLIGSEDDNPLFGEIHDPEELTEALQRIAGLTPEYLLIFELLWTPQTESDSLSYNEMLLSYANMVQIA